MVMIVNPRRIPKKIVASDLKSGEYYRIRATHVECDSPDDKPIQKNRVDGVYTYDLSLTRLETEMDGVGGSLEMDEHYGDCLLLTRKTDECTLIKREVVRIPGLDESLELFDDGMVIVNCSTMLGKDMEKFCKDLLKRRGWKCVKKVKSAK